jgi:putative lipoprotein
MLRFAIAMGLALALLAACTAPSTNPNQSVSSDQGPVVVPSVVPPDADTSDDDLEGTSWTLSELVEGDQRTAALPNANIQFADGRASGRTGCNSYGAAYTKSGNSISFEAPIQTEMACEQALMDQERVFTTLFVESETYRIEDGKLILRGPNGELVFEPTSS